MSKILESYTWRSLPFPKLVVQWFANCIWLSCLGSCSPPLTRTVLLLCTLYFEVSCGFLSGRAKRQETAKNIIKLKTTEQDLSSTVGDTLPRRGRDYPKVTGTRPRTNFWPTLLGWLLLDNGVVPSTTRRLCLPHCCIDLPSQG